MGAYFAARKSRLGRAILLGICDVSQILCCSIFFHVPTYMRDWLDVCTHRMDDVFFVVHILCMTIGFNK